MSHSVWTAYEKNSPQTWPTASRGSVRSKIWPLPESFFLVYGRKVGARKNGYHKALCLENGMFCWPLDHVVAWSRGPVFPDGSNESGFRVLWNRRDSQVPSSAVDVLVLCKFMTGKLHWTVSRYDSASNSWSAEKNGISVVFWADIPPFTY